MTPNVIYLTRHGQSEYNVYDKIGGNSNLSKLGESYSKKLFDYIDRKEDVNKIRIYTSDLLRTKQTGRYFPNKNKINLEILNEINAGKFEDFTFEEFERNNKEEYERRNRDKFYYRYPNGESYHDLKQRVFKVNKFINTDLENSKPVIIICHKAVLRILYGLFLNIPNNEIPNIDIPLHVLFKFEKINDKFKVSLINLDPKS